MGFSGALWAALFAHLLSQVILKGIIFSYKEKKIRWKNFTRYGGMPSGHASLSMGPVGYFFFHEGINSSLLAISIVYALLFNVDAVKFRLVVQRYFVHLRELYVKVEGRPLEKLPVSLGHEPIEVLVGAALGFASGYVCVLMGL